MTGGRDFKTWACRVKMYWNLIWKSPGFVPFGANLTHFGSKSGHPVSVPFPATGSSNKRRFPETLRWWKDVCVLTARLSVVSGELDPFPSLDDSCPPAGTLLNVLSSKMLRDHSGVRFVYQSGSEWPHMGKIRDMSYSQISTFWREIWSQKSRISPIFGAGVSDFGSNLVRLTPNTTNLYY